MRWQFSEEGKEWRWPTEAKPATSEVGEQVQLVLQGSDKDVFGNHIGVPLSASAKADLLAILFEGVCRTRGKNHR